MVDELEPGPDPSRRNRGRPSRRPDRVDEALRLYHANRPLSLRKNSETEAHAVVSEIKAAIHYLRTWEFDPDTGEKYKISAISNITEHYAWDGVEYVFFNSQKIGVGWGRTGDLRPQWAHAAFARMLGDAARDGAEIFHYWKVNYRVRAPEVRGFGAMQPDKLAAAHKRSMQTRGVIRQPRRTVAEGAPDSGERDDREERNVG